MTTNEGRFGLERFTSLGPFVEEQDQYNTDIDVYFKSSENMSELSDESVHLSVTSPPYNMGWDYGPNYDDTDTYEGYINDLRNVFSEVYRVLTPQGRLCVNIPTLQRASDGYGISHMSNIIKDVFEDSSNDWQIREVIIWDKERGQPPDPRYTSTPNPWGVILNNVNEAIIVAQKPGKRRTSNRPSEDIRVDSVFEVDKEPHDMLTDVWEIPPGSYIDDGGNRIPTFPSELPRRLIKLYSFKTDTVLDPFTGSGRTLGVANDLDRNAIGYEVRSELKPVIEREVGQSIELNPQQSSLGSFNQ